MIPLRLGNLILPNVERLRDCHLVRRPIRFLTFFAITGRSCSQLPILFSKLPKKLLWPDLIILGGGVSKKADRFLPYLTVQAELVTAQLQNEAGIVGAALAAKRGG